MTDALQPHRVWWPRLWRAALLALLLGWFGRYAYLRLSTPPMDENRVFDQWLVDLGPPPEDDAWGELVAALDMIPPAPPFSEPAPPGMQWEFPGRFPATIDVSDVLNGDWDPAARPHLRAALEYVNSTGVSRALEKIQELRGRPWFPRSEGQAEAWRFLGSVNQKLRHATALLAARARYRMNERGDAEGAWQDLRTILECAGGVRGSARHLLRGGFTEELALDELIRLTTEFTIPENLATDMDLAISALPSEVDNAAKALEVRAAYCRWAIRSAFTDRHHGAWAVLSFDRAEASPIWNLASAVYNNRDAVEAKLDRFFDSIRRLPHLPWHQVRDSRVADQPAFNLLDGPAVMAMSEHGAFDGWYEICHAHVKRAATRRAARMAIAINRYHAEHGRCPMMLSDLAPDYLSAVPVDPFCGQPFHYDGSELFIRSPRQILAYAGLYSCGADGQDDGGISGSRYATEGRGWTQGDDQYSLTRGEPDYEPTLEPISTEVAPGSGAGSSGDAP
jgi:hypothetical protein